MLKNYDIAKLFTSRAISSIIRGDFSMVSKIAENYQISKKQDYSLADFFDLTLDKVSIEYKAEYFYKNLIANKLFLELHGNDATMLSEFRVGGNKADCIILNGSSKCYEIKTEFDTLNRLPEQLVSYLSIFDMVYVVVAEKHLDKVRLSIPRSVGIKKMLDSGELVDVRLAKEFKGKVDHVAMFHALRKEEYLDIIKKYFNEIPDVNNMEIFNICLEKFKKIPSSKLRRLFTDTLKKHRANDFAFIRDLPKSLVSSAVSYNIPKNKQKIFVDSLNTPISNIIK